MATARDLRAGLPSNFANFSPTQKIDYFNRIGATPQELLAADPTLTQEGLDFMRREGYAVVNPPTTFTDDQVAQYFAENPGISEAQIAEAMRQTGVSPEQVARVTGADPGYVSQQYSNFLNQVNQAQIADYGPPSPRDVRSELPSDWSNYSPDQKIDYFNQNNITPQELLRADPTLTQAGIDWMRSQGYAGGTTGGGTTEGGAGTGSETVTINRGNTYQPFGNPNYTWNSLDPVSTKQSIVQRMLADGYSAQQVRDEISRLETDRSTLTEANFNLLGLGTNYVDQQAIDMLADFDARMTTALASGDFSSVVDLVNTAVGIYGPDTLVNLANYLNTDPKYAGLREQVGGALYTPENLLDFLGQFPTGDGTQPPPGGTTYQPFGNPNYTWNSLDPVSTKQSIVQRMLADGYSIQQIRDEISRLETDRSALTEENFILLGLGVLPVVPPIVPPGGGTGGTGGTGGRLVSELTGGLPYGGGIYKRTPAEETMYQRELQSIPVNASVPLPTIPMSLGLSPGRTFVEETGNITPEQYYANIRETVGDPQYTPAEIRQLQQQYGVSNQDINVAFGRGVAPITFTTPTMLGALRDLRTSLPSNFADYTPDQKISYFNQVKATPGELLKADPNLGQQDLGILANMGYVATPDPRQSISQFIQSRAPTTSVAMPTAPSMFSPENVNAQLELERLRLQPTPEPVITAQGTPVAGFAEGGLVGNDINRLLQNQRNAVQRESQSRQMLTNLGAPPVKKFSDGGPAGSSSGVRRLEMSKIRKRQEGSPVEGEMADDMFIQEMMVGTRPTDQEAFVERTSDVLSKTPKSQELANQIRNLFQSLETPSPSAQEEYLERRPTPESREPIRSRKAMEAFLKAANPRLEIEERPLPGGKFGFVRADDPDTLVISTRQFPAQREETAFHELEHSLSERGGNPLGKLSKEGKPIVMDNNYRFDVLYNQDKKIGGEGRFARHDMMNRFIKNKDKLEKFFGRPFDSNYFSREPESGLFAEQIADLSALEQVTNKSLTRDPEMRKLLFPDDKAAAVYDAITGLRQTRLDAKDLPPYTPNYPEEKSMMDWIRGKLGMDKK